MPLIDGKKLEDYRNRKGVTQGAIAKSIGISQGAYSVREKTGNFDDTELLIICKQLGVKKEQILLVDSGVTNVPGMEFLVTKAIQTESALTVLLGAVAEILAKQTGSSVTKVRTELQSAANSLSKASLDELRPTE